MKLYTILCSVFLYVWTVESQSFQPSFLESYLNFYRGFRNGWGKSIGRNSEDPIHMKKVREKGMLQKQFPPSFPFPCNVAGFRSLRPPSNVNQIRPGDIDIVAALGDSLTAGNGIVATDLFHILIENRGLSWSIGGQGTWRQFITMPNILKEFNPNLFGFSTKDSITTDHESQFNPAEPAALSSEMPYMAQVLIKRIKSDPRVDLKEHWKLITIMAGANDFCLDICFKDDLKLVLEQHRTDYLTMLRILRDNLPRTIINITPPPNVKLVKAIKGKPVICQLLHNVVECPCFFSDTFKAKLDVFYDVIDQWQLIDEEITSMTEFQTNDFAVVYQPFIMGAAVPLLTANKSDFSSLSIDCFHLSQRMQARSGTSLWNNMLEKVGKKSKVVFPLIDLICPTNEHPYIFTAQNSNL